MSVQSSYAAWLRDFADDAETVAELKAIAGDEKEIEDRFYTSLSFGTAGMRGVLGAGDNRMNRYNVRRATRGLADYIHTLPDAAKRGVVIAFDSRKFSDVFAEDAARVLAAQGIPAMLFDSLRPVPVLSFAVRYTRAIAGIVITASHNPPQYNGYKVYWEDGAQLPPERADAVLACIRARAYTECNPMPRAEAMERGLLRIVGKEIDDAYDAKIRSLVVSPELLRDHGGELRIVYTPLHGSGNLPVRRVLQSVGITHLSVVREQEAPDPAFPTVRVPNPEEPDAFRLAIALADKERADVAFATDPDCDRLGVAVRKPDGSFVLLTGNQIGCVLLYALLTRKQAAGTLPKDGAMVKSIVSTELARAIADAYGVRTVEVLTGFKFIAERIEQFEAAGTPTFLFGFEESYGFLSSTFVRDKDAVNASLLVAETALWLKQDGRTLYDLLQGIYARFGFAVERNLSVSLPGKDGLQQMDALMRRLRDTPPTEIGGIPVAAVRDYETSMRTDARGVTAIDLPRSNVLYYELAGGQWLCVRPSGTEPKVKLYVGAYAKTAEAAEDTAARMLAAGKTLLS